MKAVGAVAGVLAVVGAFSLASFGCVGRLPDDRAGLIDAMESNNMATSTAAAEKLERMYGRQGLLEALATGAPGARALAARKLGNLDGDDVKMALLEHVESDPDPFARMWAIIRLGDIGGKEAIPALERNVNSANPDVARAARDAIAQIRRREHIER